MSWLRNHMRHFVIPGVHALARADGRALRESDLKPSDREVRPATVCEYPEAGMLYAVVSSVLKKSNTTRDVALGLCRSLGKPGDSKFVYQFDSQNRVKELAEGYEGIEGADVLHSFVLNSIKSLKRKTHKRATVVYPGRDVWCWEVLSQKLGLPSVFDSRVSRDVAGHEPALKKAMADWHVSDWERTVLFDSGYEGTVPRAIGRAAGIKNINVLMLSASKTNEQIFPTHAKSRRKALACEYLAKYQKRSVVRDGEAYQELAGLDEFIKAALLTIWLWHHVSPAKLPSWKERPAPKFSGVKFSNYGNSIISPTNYGNISIVAGSGLTIGNGGSLYTPVSNGWITTASTATGIHPFTGFYNPFVTGGSSSAIANYTVPMLDPATMQLVPNPAQPSPASSPGGPVVKPVIHPATNRITVTPVTTPIVTDRNGKPICF